MKSLHLINQQLEQLPAEQRQAIVTLIDFKTDSDVERVLNKLNTFEAKLEAIDNKFEAKLTAMNDKFDTRFTVLMWMVGGLIALMIGLFSAMFGLITSTLN